MNDECPMTKEMLTELGSLGCGAGAPNSKVAADVRRLTALHCSLGKVRSSSRRLLHSQKARCATFQRRWLGGLLGLLRCREHQLPP